ncbi:MAG: glycyl-radical enzyme activating protein [Spirochaetales bacterium]|nr:glycyl-radical enzyme activating protein [Spirochaetales bacterium]
MEGIIFDIQYYSIYDGPGIRTCVYFKGCPLKCSWCHNPESQNPDYEIAYSINRCKQCRQCIDHCDNNAISLLKNRIQRDIKRCRMCGKCVDCCPENALERIGKCISSDMIAEIVSRDCAFYKDSGGGVTISGGEPTAQVEFLKDTLKEIKNRDIHTAIETCGWFCREIIHDLSKVTDLFLFDIKHMNREKHKQGTGVYPDTILENFKEIVSEYGNGKIIPRIPLIPGFNTYSESINEIMAFLSEAGYSGIIHLMPYNRISLSKYGKLGKSDQFKDMGIQNEDELNMIIKKFEDNGFSVLCNR